MDLQYKKIRDLINFNFRIPVFQRGYRWDKIQVSQFIKDIFEDMSKEYLLQTLIVSKKGKDYIVIDGQQRLTTLFIVFAALKKLQNVNYDPLFEISYDSRHESKKFLDSLFNDKKSNVEFGMNLDFKYMQQAFEVSCDELQSIKGKNIQYDNLKKHIFEKCEFIWYETQNDKLTENSDEKIFRDINMGKIPLMSSELIKAEIIKDKIAENRKVDKSWIIHFVDKWNGIEKKLNEPDFWAFIPHENQYDIDSYNELHRTRIDKLFQILLIKNSDTYDFRKDKYNDLQLFNKFCEMKDSIATWSKLLELFNTITELYLSDGRMNKLQSFMLNSNDKSDKKYKSEPIYNLLSYAMYIKSKLLNEPKFSSQEIFAKVMYNARDERTKCIKDDIQKDLFEIFCSADKKDKQSLFLAIRKLSYREQDKQNNNKIQAILMLYNIALLKNNLGLGSRFNFLEYSNWSIEHIFSQNEKIIKFEESEYKEINNAIKENEKKINEKNNELKKILKNVPIEKHTKIEENYKNKIELYKKEIKKFDKQLLNIWTEADIFNIRKEIIYTTLEYYDKKNVRDVSSYSKILKEIADCIEIIECLNLDTISTDWSKVNTYNILKDCSDEILFYIVQNKYNKQYENINIFLEKCISNNQIKKISDLFELKELPIYISIMLKNDDCKNIDTDGTDENYSQNHKLTELIDKVKISAINRFISEYCSDTYKTIKVKALKKFCNYKIDDYFKNNHNRYMCSNTIENLALLRSYENKVIGNCYIEKKMKINEFLSTKTVMPYSTIFVFTDRFNELQKLNNGEHWQWLPPSRDEYINHILKTIDSYIFED